METWIHDMICEHDYEADWEKKKVKEILNSLDEIKMHLKEDGLYALGVLYDYVDELKKPDNNDLPF